MKDIWRYIKTSVNKLTYAKYLNRRGRVIYCRFKTGHINLTHLYILSVQFIVVDTWQSKNCVTHSHVRNQINSQPRIETLKQDENIKKLLTFLKEINLNYDT